MANIDNDLSKLQIEQQYHNHNNHLHILYDLQKKTQDAYLAKYGLASFDDMTLKQLAEFWLLMKHAIEDELSEAFDALGGIDDGIGNAVWKPWKKANAKASEMKISDLSKSDLVNLKMELVDVLHFVLTMFISIGMKPNEIFDYYLSKNKENWNRMSNNY